MKKITFLFFSLMSMIGLQAQILTPVTWTWTSKQVSDTEFDLIFTATIDEGWTVYSQYLESEDGPIPTSFHFEKSNHFELVGKNKESGTIKKGYDDIFRMNLTKIYKKGIFTQRVRMKDFSKPIAGYLEFMTCDAKQCLPPTEEEFSFQLTAATIKGIEKPAKDAVIVKPETLNIQPIAFDTTTIPQQAEEIVANMSTTDTASINPNSPNQILFGGLQKPDLANPVAACGDATLQADGKSNWTIFLLGFLGGLIALLTPCVFPMIPLTVSYFTKGSENRRKGITNASLYGFFIFAVYLLLSVPFHLLDNVNPDILNDISTNVWLNIAFFAIFMIFAFSFFGYYELTLPSSWVSRASSAEGVGGVIGVFFMALTLALVSFSCTGPILGSLLAGALSSDGGAWQLTAGMGGFGLALALPFALFAAFPSMMTSLPKSGGWLNTVKVTLGFIEVGLALKFLSNADLVKDWGILKIEPFLAAWLLLSLGLAAYLFGFIKFPHDSPIKKLSITRLVIGLTSVAFAFYLATGFIYDEKAGSYRPLKLLSGLAPPVCYSWFYECDCPQNLNCFKDLKEGMAYAKEVNKPIMIDFTGHACVNCRKMEEHVWPEPEVYKYLKNDYVIISLYVDEKVDLEAAEQLEVVKATGGKRTLRNHGHKWSHFQTEYFNANSQPMYVLFSPNGKLLNNPVGYTPDENEYASFLQCGLDAYKSLELKPVLGAK